MQHCCRRSCQLALVLQDCYRKTDRVESVGDSMDLNTITSGGPAESARRAARLDGRRCLARGRHLAVLGTAGPSEPADRPDRPEMAGADHRRERALDRGDLHHRATRRARLPAGLARRAADQPMLPRLSRLVQDLEDGDRRRQSLHVAAGGADDLADLGARRRLHDLAGRRRRAEELRSPISSPATAPTCSSPANCCGRSTFRLPR